MEEQLAAIKNLTSQIETADTENKKIIVLGDANLCASKWNEHDFTLKIVAEELKSTLAQCGMINVELGHTYLADRMTEAGQPIQSSLDHIYRSDELDQCTISKKLENSSTDHVPIMISIIDKKSTNSINKVTKRCFSKSLMSTLARKKH